MYVRMYVHACMRTYVCMYVCIHLQYFNLCANTIYIIYQLWITKFHPSYLNSFGPQPGDIACHGRGHAAVGPPSHTAVQRDWAPGGPMGCHRLMVSMEVSPFARSARLLALYHCTFQQFAVHSLYTVQVHSCNGCAGRSQHAAYLYLHNLSSP